jgi:polyferredoxin
VHILLGFALALGILWVLTATAWGRKVLLGLVALGVVYSIVCGLVVLNDYQDFHKKQLREAQEISVEHAKMAALSPPALSAFCAHADEKDPDVLAALKMMDHANGYCLK